MKRKREYFTSHRFPKNIFLIVLKFKKFFETPSRYKIQYIFISSERKIYFFTIVTHHAGGSVDFTARSPHPKSGPARSSIFHKTLISFSPSPPFSSSLSFRTATLLTWAKIASRPNGRGKEMPISCAQQGSKRDVFVPLSSSRRSFLFSPLPLPLSAIRTHVECTPI